MPARRSARSRRDELPTVSSSKLSSKAQQSPSPPMSPAVEPVKNPRGRPRTRDGKQGVDEFKLARSVEGGELAARAKAKRLRGRPRAQSPVKPLTPPEEEEEEEEEDGEEEGAEGVQEAEEADDEEEEEEEEEREEEVEEKEEPGEETQVTRKEIPCSSAPGSSEVGSSPAAEIQEQGGDQEGAQEIRAEPDIAEERSRSSLGRDEKTRDETLERNIEKVCFGDIIFRAWYPSWYPKEQLADTRGDGEARASHHLGGEKEKEKERMTEMLYVCEQCFAYTADVKEYLQHRGVCEWSGGVPGREIYCHGGGCWSVREVDGEVDTVRGYHSACRFSSIRTAKFLTGEIIQTFSQSLSLFAKLFLDNKSVFFDVSSFKYFLLVHTSPTTHAKQVVGFFSKEKMSWDNNNLACILIFPPWQRKGLGSVLMGVSYAISRREGILGGPEKPISELGRGAYRRFWAGEIARWLLQQDVSKKGKGGAEEITVEDVSRGTWIVVEDCLGVLREMAVVEVVKGKKKEEEEWKVRLDKKSVRDWVEREGVGLARVVDEEGFLEGFAMNKDLDSEEDAIVE